MSVRIIEPAVEAGNSKIGIVVSKWNSSITEKMLNGALKVLSGAGVPDGNILIVRCPGAFEIPLTAQYLITEQEVDGVITLGVVIRGGTPHFEYVCDAVTSGITELNLKYQKPVAFGILTTDDVKQAMDRSGEKGNKGGEAALALLEMLDLQRKLSAK